MRRIDRPTKVRRFRAVGLAAIAWIGIVTLSAAEAGCASRSLPTTSVATTAESTPSALSTQELAAERAAVFRNPLVVGASVSAGYARTDDLSQTLEVVFGSEFELTANSMVFANPVQALTLQMQYAQTIDASMLIGVDLLFWFGFGPDRGTSRTEYLDRGLALLDAFEGPVVIGDLPTIRDAHPRFLPPRWIPSDETIARLNQRLRSWADARDRVTWIGLAGLVRALKEGRPVEIGDREFSATPEEVFAWDRLHLSDAGGVMLALLVADHLAGRWPGGVDLDLDPGRVETRVRESRAR